MWEVARAVVMNGHTNDPATPENMPLTFSEEDRHGLVFLNEDAKVISAIISTTEVRRILVATGSLMDILFLSTFKEMGLSEELENSQRVTLMGFEGSTI
ncbi:UNVERIFIED_CONTAM: hypothetical protein Slati_2469900 [Sesamum latifolium]|uniref:Uncharacterized protein n=1 Tax=Sesamum latifolium TaxID=2727402 RepID=A0AAW2WDP7_9LAMI